MTRFKIVDAGRNEYVIGYHSRRSAERNAARLSRVLGKRLRVVSYGAPRRVVVRIVRHGRGCESLKSMRQRAASNLQMCILHFEKLTSCFCKRTGPLCRVAGKKRRIRCVRLCRRCSTIRNAKRELRRAGIKWVPGVESDAV